MRLIPHIAGATQWEKYYKDLSAGRLRSQLNVQKGYGGTLGPRLHARNYRNVEDTIEPMNIITPTAAATAQARSEIKTRQVNNKKRKEGVLVGRGQKRKAGGGGGGHKKRAKKSVPAMKRKKKTGVGNKRKTKRISKVGKQHMARDIFM